MFCYQFEQEYQCRVILDTYDSNESMYSKLKAGATGYDIIFPSNYILDLLNQQGMLQAASNEIRALKKFIEGLNTKIAQLESDLKFQTGIANCQLKDTVSLNPPAPVPDNGLVNA